MDRGTQTDHTSLISSRDQTKNITVFANSSGFTSWLYGRKIKPTHVF